MVFDSDCSSSTQQPNKCSATASTHTGSAESTVDPTLERIGTRKLYTVIHDLLHLKPVLPNAGQAFSMSINEQPLTKSVCIFNEENKEREVTEMRLTAAQAEFAFTHFNEPLQWDVMEIAATLLCEHISRDTTRNEERLHKAAIIAARVQAKRDGITFKEDIIRPVVSAGPTFLVSVGARGAGALAQAAALRLHVPYSLSNWYPDGSIGDCRVDRCEGVGGQGWVYLNGLPKNARVAIVIDAISTGVTAGRLAKGIVEAGCTVVGVYAIVEYESGSREYLSSFLESGTPIRSLFSVSLDHECTIASTRVVNDLAVDASLSGAAMPATCRVPRRLPESTVQRLKKMSPAEVQAKIRRVSASFINVPIVVNHNVNYPYCFFSLTDFKPALDPQLVEEMADLAVHFADFSRCDVLISEGDRGGGPLLQAISVRTHLPYVNASWTRISPEAAAAVAKGEKKKGMVAQSQVTHVGFSGQHSQLSLRGLRAGMRCTFVDDMLSSGGTAEAVLNCAQQLGAITVESVFVSEKLYPVPGQQLPDRKGKKRLESLYQGMVVTCLVQFVVDGQQTMEPPCRVGE